LGVGLFGDKFKEGSSTTTTRSEYRRFELLANCVELSEGDYKYKEFGCENMDNSIYSPSAAPSLSAQQLYVDCKDNKAKFDADYKGRKFYLTGKISEIDASSTEYRVKLSVASNLLELFVNTESVTVVYPKRNLPSYVQKMLGGMSAGQQYHDLVTVSSIGFSGIEVYAVIP